MAIYDFKCDKCGMHRIDVTLPITHKSEDIPKCCGMTMGYFITSAPMVHWKDPQIQPFKPVATPNAPVIHSMREHREYMKRNDLIDANELYVPPTRSEEITEVKKMMESIDAITPNAEQKEHLKRVGLDSPTTN
jgi:hypothetical protein